MTKAKNSCGFTLVETIVTVLVFMVILSGVYSAFLVGNRAWRHYKQDIAYKGEIRRAMMAMTSELREARNVLVINEAGSVRVNFYRTDVGFVSYIWTMYGEQANKIVRLNAGEMRILGNDIKRFTVKQMPSSLSINISTRVEEKKKEFDIVLSKKIVLRSKTKALL